MNGAIYVSDSKNEKISGNSKIDATYVSIQKTCPSSCSLKETGCYAQIGNVGIHSRRLDGEAKDLDPLSVARAEAKAINNSYGGGPVPYRYLRLHVSGDCRVVKGARIINRAVGKWKQRGGKTAYSYTHAYAHVHRKEWNNVSMLASVDTIEQAKVAKDQGYAPAIVVAEHISNKTYLLSGSNIKWIPCPSQTADVSCSDCGLCMNADRLFDEGFGIAFAAHGVMQNKIKRRLDVIQ